MLSSAEGMRARTLLRRSVGATIALGVFAGLAGGAALGIWGIARRTTTSYDRFVAYEHASTVGVIGCPPGVTEDDIGMAGFQEVCGSYDYADVLDHLAGVPGIESVGRWTMALGWVARADDPSGGWRQLIPVAIDPGAIEALGRPIIVAGRSADPHDAGEGTVNEELADRLGLELGDELMITPYRRDEFDIAGEGKEPPEGPATRVTVVGITRRPSDLTGRLHATSGYEDGSTVLLGPAWWAAVDGDVANYAIGATATLAPGADVDIAELVEAQFPGQLWMAERGPMLGQDNQRTILDAIELQALGVDLMALVVAAAGLLFAGQAVSRQVRREWSDADVLDTLGMTRSAMVRAAALRAIAISMIGVLVAAVVAVAISPIGPIGIGRLAEPHPGVRFDPVVMVVGLPVVALLVVGFATAPVATLRRRPRALPATTSLRLGALPPTGVAGWAMTLARRGGRLAVGSAIAGVALTSMAGLAAWTLTSSYDELVASPARYGSTWDATVGNVSNEQQAVETRAALEAIPGVEAVGIRSAQGIDRDDEFVIMAGEPFIGDQAIGAILDGRAPSAPNEVALGRQSLDDFGASIGEQVTLVDPNDPTIRGTFDVVGEAIINDAMSAEVGRGALITNEALDTVSPQTQSQRYAVWVEASADRAATLEAVRTAFPTTYLERSTPRQVLDLDLVAGQPVLLAVIVAALAGIALVHALVSSVRGNRAQIGVLKSIGFTRRQVSASVAWHASLLSIAALVIGVPLGIVLGRVSWIAIVNRLGVDSHPVLPLRAGVIVIVTVLLAANIAALMPGLSAARTRPAAALRTE